MDCGLDTLCKTEKFIFSLLINIVAILGSILSIGCVNIYGSIDLSLRQILTSFSVANFIGAVIMIFDTASSICNGKRFLSCISISVSLIHLLLILLQDYVRLKNSSKRPLPQFIGLIFVCWLISITMGFVVAVIESDEKRNVARLIYTLSFFLVATFIIFMYISVKRRDHTRRETMDLFQKRYLKVDHPKNKIVSECWSLNYSIAMQISYVILTLPWVVNEFFKAVSHKHGGNNADVITILLNGINLYTPSIVCIRLWRKCQREENKVAPVPFQCRENRNMFERTETSEIF